MTGATVTKYEVLRSVARGGMGEVFLARQKGIAGFTREVVVKRIHANYADDPEFVKMFLQEARIAALLDHPNIVQIFELGKQQNNYFIVMEYVEGLSLSRLIRAVGGPLPIPIAIQIACGVAEGLQFAHNKTHRGAPLNLVHRDVSPPNILLSTAGSVKIADFGIAKVRWSVVQTQAGIVKGKYYYISPEQARGEAVDPRSDIYSMGLVLYEMTTGRRAYTFESDADALNAAAAGAITSPVAVMPDYPRDLERVVLRALALDPADRYGECHELQEDLTSFMVARSQVLSPAKLGQFVEGVMGGTSGIRSEEADSTRKDGSPAGEATSVDNVAELQTFILRRVDGPPTLSEEPTALIAREEPIDEVGTEIPTAVLESSLAETREVVAADPTTETLLLPRPPYPTEDDEPTKLDTRLPPLDEAAARTPKRTQRVVHSGATPRFRVAHLGLLFAVAVVAGVVTRWALKPSARGGTTVTAEAGALLRADAPALPDMYVAVPDLPLPDSPGADVVPAFDLAPPDLPLSRPEHRRPVSWGGHRPPARPKRPVTPPRRPITLPGEATVVLSLTTDPPTEVYLGRRRLGKTPLTASVPAGALDLRFRNRMQRLDASRTLQPRGTSLAVRFVFRRGTLVLALPPGRLVKLDGKLLGKTPRPPVDLYEGRHTIVVLDGPTKLRLRRRIVVPAGKRVSISEE